MIIFDGPSARRTLFGTPRMNVNRSRSCFRFKNLNANLFFPLHLGFFELRQACLIPRQIQQENLSVWHLTLISYCLTWCQTQGCIGLIQPIGSVNHYPQ